MKLLLIFSLLIGVGTYQIYYKQKPSQEILMDVGPSEIINTSSGGIVDIDPREIDYTDVTQFAETGLLTVVILYDDTCRKCQILHGKLGKFTKRRPDVSIKIVHVGHVYDYSSPMGMDVDFLPYVTILDRKGQILVQDRLKPSEGYDQLHKWMRAEMRG